MIKPTEVLRGKYLVGPKNDFVAVYRVIAEEPDGVLKLLGVRAFGYGAGWWEGHEAGTISRHRSEFSDWTSCRNKGEALALAEHLWDEIKLEEARERARKEKEQVLQSAIGSSQEPPIHADEQIGTFRPEN